MARAATSARIVSIVTSPPAAVSSSTTGITRLSSSSRLGRTAPGSGRLSADVDEVGAVGEQLLAMLDCCDRRGVQATVGERVRRDVDDAHHEAPTRLGQAFDGLRGYGGHG